MARMLTLVILLAALAMGAASCGKKGPPQPPDEAFYSLRGK